MNWLTDRLIDFNAMLSCAGLFYAQKLRWLYVYIYSLCVFLKEFILLHTVLSNTTNL